MESLYLLIPLSLLLTVVIGLIFMWATRNGQFDDLDSPAHRILLDDDQVEPDSSRAKTDSPRRNP